MHYHNNKYNSNKCPAIPRARKVCEKTSVARMSQSSHQKLSLAVTARAQKRSTTAMVETVIPTTATAMMPGPRSPVRIVVGPSKLIAVCTLGLVW